MLEIADGMNGRSETLRSISRALARPLDERAALRATHAELARALDVTMCFFGHFDAASQTVDVVWQVHAGAELEGGQFPLGDGPTSQAIRTRQPMLIRNWSSGGPAVQVQYATERPALPESSVVVPVMYADQVVGVLSVQSYTPEAYDDDDVQLLTAVAGLLAIAVWGRTGSTVSTSETDTIVASMADALLVLDDQGRVVRLNCAARRLLCTRGGGVVLGQPIDRPQAEQWPLGSEELSRQLQPIVRQLERGDSPDEEIALTLEGGTVRCRASVLRKSGAASGAVMVLRNSA